MYRTPITIVALTLGLLLGPSNGAEAQLVRAGAWAFGPTYAVDEDQARNLAFVGSGGVVRVVNLSNPAVPQHVADLHTHGLVEDVFYDAASQRLFLACGEGGMEIWDLADPAAPALLGRTEILYFDVETPVGHVEVTGDIAVAECAWGYVHTLDVGDPTAPVQVAFNGVMGNPAHDINIGTGGQIHTTGAQYYVRLGVDSGGNLTVTGQKNFDFGAGKVFGTPEVAYVGYGGSMVILDLLLPGFPAWSITNVGGITEIEVRDSRAYLVNQNGLRIYDVSSYSSPLLLAEVSRERLYRDLVVTPPYAYVAAGPAGLEVFDVADPSSPSVAATYPDVYGGVADAEIRDGYAYVADFQAGLVIVDTSNLEAVEVGRFDSPGSAYDVALQGNLAFLADVEGGLRIVDISDPTAPTEVGFLDDFDVWRVEPYGDVVYAIESIPNQPYRFHTIDVSTPSAPVDIGAVTLPDWAWGFARSGSTLYVAGDGGGIVVYDLSVPTAPVELATYPVPDVTGLDLVGDILYVASFAIGGVDGGLYVLDVSDPMMPVQLAHLYDPGFLPLHVHADGGFAYAAVGDDLRLFDVSDPSSPVEIDSYTTPWDIFRISSVAGTLYLADGHAGLQVVDNTAYADTAIFSDGFESGDLSSWTAAVPSP